MNFFVAAPGSAKKGISSCEPSCLKDNVEQEEGKGQGNSLASFKILSVQFDLSKNLSLIFNLLCYLMTLLVLKKRRKHQP
jgi:hypothetical protein